MLMLGLLLPTPGFCQGSLTPPGAPAPTMKSLDQVEPRIPLAGGTNAIFISDPGSYYLTGNLTIPGDSFDAIDIDANNVTLDLRGFTIMSTKKIASNNTGVSANFIGVTNVTIRNGNIVGFVYGVLSRADQTTIENMTISDSRMRAINVLGNGSNSFSTVIRNNVIYNTTESQNGNPNNPATGILLQAGANGVIEGNVITGVFGSGGQTSIGIDVEGATYAQVVNNRIANSVNGIQFLGPGSYRDNITSLVTNAYTGGTNLGNNQ